MAVENQPFPFEESNKHSFIMPILLIPGVVMCCCKLINGSHWQGLDNAINETAPPSTGSGGNSRTPGSNLSAFRVTIHKFFSMNIRQFDNHPVN